VYFWLLEKTESPLLAGIVSTLIYTAFLLAITLFSELPADTFRYLDL
jgi:hypothetical protein